MKTDQPKRETQPSSGSGKWLFGGGLAAAFAATLCCIGPLVFAGLGLGAFAAAGFFHEMRPFFLGLAIFFVAGAWIWDWRKRRLASRENSETGASCGTGCQPRSRLGLILFTAVALLLGASPFILQEWPEGTSETSSSSSMTTADTGVSNLAVWKAELEGLYCASCVAGLQQAFENVDGVGTAEVTYRPQKAIVHYDSERVESGRFREIVEDFGYSVVTVK